MRALAAEFQITVGANFSAAMASTPKVFEGWAFTPRGKRRGRTTVAVVNGALSAFIRRKNDIVTELKTDPTTGQLLALHLGLHSLEATCHEQEVGHNVIATMSSETKPYSEADWVPSKIAPQWGTDPASGKIVKYEEPIPNTALYDLSLPEATVMVVLAKDATGSESASNLATKASTYLARMANLATIWENQLGIRLLVSELILTPDTTAYSDVGESLSAFRSWGNTNRPRSQYPRSVAARFGNLGFSGSTIGIAYVGVVTGSSGYSINKTNFNFTLAAHEMGHNFGTSHSSGGVMNSSYQGGQRDFYRDVSAGETSAKDIYDHSKSRLYGPASLRHAEEIPFARDDSFSTPVDTPLLVNPTANDDASVRNGATNSLSIAEVSRVYPPHAGRAELAGEIGVLFTPTTGFEGYAWFSYSLQGDVGNSGRGWLHRGDVAVLVGTDPTDDLNIVLAPGQSFIFDPPGSGSATIQSQALQSLVDVTRDDSKLLIIRTSADAAGVDSFVVRRSSINYTINITYLSEPAIGLGDVVTIEAGANSVRFNPMSNDDGVGYRRPLQMGARIGVDGVSEDYFPNAFRLLSATNLDPAKGALTVETINVVSNGSNLQAPTGILSFVPAQGATGVADIEYLIEDAAGHQSTGVATIVLSLLNITSPTVTSVTIPVGSGLLVEGSATSSSAGGLSGLVTVNWETISAPSSGIATFAALQSLNTSIRFSDPGTYLLRVTGTDRGFTTSQTLTVVVAPSTTGGENLGPEVALTNIVVSVTAGGPFSVSGTLPIVSDDGLPSPPSATSTFWNQLAGAGPVVFADPSVLLTTATFPFPGLYTLRLVAHDGEVKTFDEVVLNYTGPGDGVPVTTGISDLHLSENAPDALIDLFAVFEDGEDSDAALSYSIEGNTNASLFTSATIAGDPEQLTLQFVASATGTSQLTIRATDTSGSFVETMFLVTIANSPPVIAPIADQILAEGQSLNLVVSASDPDHHGLTYSLIAGAPPGMTIDPASGALNWLTGEGHGPASYPVVVRVVDESSLALSTTEYFLVSVSEVNEPPVISPLANITNFAQQEFTLSLAVTDPDLPVNNLSFSLEVAPAGATIDAQSRTINWTPAMAGTYAFTLRVDDGGSPNLSDTESFTLEVTNAAPTIANQSFGLPENSVVGTPVGTVGANDGDGDGFTFAITSGNPGGAFAIDPNSGLLTVNASAPLDFESSPTITLTVEATDDAVPPLSRPATITVNLSGLNEAPSLPDQTLEASIGALFGSVIATVSATDPENDPLTYTIISGNSAGVFALDAQSGALSIAAQATLNTPPILTISVSDDAQPGLTDSGLVTIALKQVLVSDPAEARILVPLITSPTSTWKDLLFDDASWTNGQTGVGYERNSGYEALLNTDVEAEMYATNASVWIRIPFLVDNPAPLTKLTMRMKYDDGFVAYLNGQRIESRNAPSEPLAWNEEATDDHSDSAAVTFEEYDLSAFLNALVAGDNVLAIHGLNGGSSSSDMLIVPELTTTGGGTIGLTTLPVIAGPLVDAVTSSSAVLRGDLLFGGGEDPELFAVWGATDGGTDAAQWDHALSAGIQGEGVVAFPISGLVPDTLFHVRFYAENSAGRAWSAATLSFTTSSLPQLTTTLVASGATARYLIPIDATDETSWRSSGYDDNQWPRGATGIGYDRNSGYQQFVSTDVEAAMYSNNATIYLRFPFSLVDPDSVDALTLRMKYDDAYVAFLNGTEIYRTPNAATTLTWNAGAISSHPDADALVFQEVDVLATAAASLQEGANVLAIHGMNRGTTSSDLLFVPELIAAASEKSYLAWIVGFPQLQGSAQFTGSNPDGDRLSNFLEYAFGLSPTVLDASSPTHVAEPEFHLVTDQVGDHIEVRFRRRMDYHLHGLSYEVQASPDLTGQNWTTAPTSAVGIPVPTGDGVTEVLTLRISNLPTPPEFFRMQVSTGG